MNASLRMTAHVANNYAPVPETGCWIWLGAWDSCGYGKIASSGRNSIGTHRLFYAYYKGPIPDGLQVCHKCDTPSCCNPDHLFIGSVSDNAVDREVKGRGRWRTKRMAA